MLDVVCELLLYHFFEMQVTEWKPSIQITDAYAIKKQLYQIIQISIYLYNTYTYITLHNIT